MKAYLNLEWQTILEKKTLIKSLGYLLLMYAVFYWIFGNSKDLSASLFPTLVVLNSSPLYLGLFEEGKEMPMKRLLPSLPYSRSTIYWGRTWIKIIIWVAGLVLALILSLLLDIRLGSKPTAAAIWIGLGASLFVLAIEHLSIHLTGRSGPGVRSGINGGVFGLILGSGGQIFEVIQSIDPTGLRSGFIAAVAALALLSLNRTFYLRSSL